MGDTENPMSAGEFMSLTMGTGEEPKIERGTRDAVDADNLDLDALDASDDPDAAEDGNGDGGPDEDGQDEIDSDEVDLGEFSEENIEAWDARYKDDGGNFNMERLTAEFDANEGKGLNAATYDYLAAQGWKKEVVQQVEAALKTQRDAQTEKVSEADRHTMALFTLAGGPDPLRAAIEWGKKSGYTKAQQDAFNKVMDGKDLEAKEAAVALLMSRYQKSPEAAERSKPKLPRRDVTKAAGKPARASLKPFASQDEYRAALKEAGGNQKAVAEITRRWANSPARRA